MSGRPQVLLVGVTERTEAVADRLDERGLSLELAEDLEAATTALSTTSFDCVVSPEEVPDGDGSVAAGAEIVRAVRGIDGGLPVVLFGADRDSLANEAVAAGLADYVSVGPDREYDRLVGRIRNAVARRQAVRRAERQARTNEVIRDVQGALVRADSREAIEESVCEQFARSEGYSFAWIAAVDEDGLALRAMGVEGGAIEGRGAIRADERTAFADAVHEAAERGEVVVVRDVGERDGTWEAALDRPFDAVAAAPLVYGDRVWGVLVLYADRAGAFDEEERRVLGELGETVGYALNAVAVRQRMQLRERQLRRQNERLEQFASVVSHDLRNPINVARGHLELADEEVRREVGTSLDRMETIVEDVLELARQGKTIEATELVGLAVVARRAWENVDTGDATLEVVDDGTPVSTTGGTDPGDVDAPAEDGAEEGATLPADESRLVQLLENLLRNAREHGDADLIRVGTIRDEGGDLAGFFVEDDGPGIPEGEREEVLKMGYTTAQDGTGFGLAIVAEIASAHGWEPAVTEGTEGGARFEFRGLSARDQPDPGQVPVTEDGG